MNNFNQSIQTLTSILQSFSIQLSAEIAPVDEKTRFKFKELRKLEQKQQNSSFYSFDSSNAVKSIRDAFASTSISFMPKKIRKESQSFHESSINTSTAKEYFIENKGLLQKMLQRKDYQFILKSLCYMIDLQQINNQFESFNKLIQVAADLSLEVNLLNEGVFLYNEALKITNFTHNLTQRMNIFLQLSKAAQKLRQYDHARQLISKSLQYSWYLGNDSFELSCYQTMSQIYFYLSENQKQYLFHKRFSQGFLQPDSFQIMQANDSVKFFLSQNKFKHNYFSHKMLSTLNLPIPNRYSTRGQIENYMDYYKNIKLSNCDAIQILDQIIQSKEFILYELDIDYLLKNEEAQEIKISKQNMPSKIKNDNYLRALLLNRNPLTKEGQTPKLNQNVLALNLNAKIKKRSKMSLSLHNTLKKVNQKVGLRPLSQFQSGQIYMKHLQRRESIDTEKYIQIIEQSI